MTYWWRVLSRSALQVGSTHLRLSLSLRDTVRSPLESGCWTPRQLKAHAASASSPRDISVHSSLQCASESQSSFRLSDSVCRLGTALCAAALESRHRLSKPAEPRGSCDWCAEARRPRAPRVRVEEPRSKREVEVVASASASDSEGSTRGLHSLGHEASMTTAAAGAVARRGFCAGMPRPWSRRSGWLQ